MDNTNQQQPVYQERESSYIQAPISVGEWMITLLIMAIPLVNIIMLFVWAFSGNINLSKANWAKASLIWALIALVFYAIILAIFGGIMAGLMNWGY